MPAPNVDSCVIRLDVKKQTPENVRDEAFFFRLVRAGFSQRRKTLVNPVSSGMGISKEIVRETLEELDIKSTVRAEELTMEQFIALSNRLSERVEQH